MSFVFTAANPVPSLAASNARPSPSTSAWERDFKEAHAFLSDILDNGTPVARTRIRERLRFFAELAAMTPPNLYLYAQTHNLTYDQVMHYRYNLQESLGKIKLTQPSVRYGAGRKEINHPDRY